VDGSVQEQEAFTDWLRAVEALQVFLGEADGPDEAADTRQPIEDVLRAENRLRAVIGYPPRMFA
jgi:hypothetical protein